jgi:hypothetical protein
MTKTKIAVTVDTDVLRRAKRAVKSGQAPSLSAFVNNAIREKVVDEDLMQMLDEMLERTGGPLTPAERRDAERSLYGRNRGRRRKRARRAA